MRYRVLGPVAMLPRTPTAAKLRVLLATLLVRAGQVVPSETLVDELWGDRPPRTVTTTLQVYVSQLRTLLAEGRAVPGARGDLLQTCPPGYRLQVAPGELDLTVFEERVRDGRRAHDDGSHQEAAERLQEGLAQWRGAALSGVPHGPVLSAAAVHLDEARLAALDLRIAADLRCGRHVRLTPELVALAAEHPYRESLHAHLMVALYRSERQSDALAAYRRLRGALVDELGVEPGPGLSRLHERILRSDPALDWRPAPGGRAAAPQLWLPPGAAELLGRDRSTAAALRMLQGDADNAPAHMLAVSGRAGVGKTAFALDLARRWAEHLPDGQLLVPLRGPDGEPLDTGAAVAAVLRSLGHESPRTSSPERELAARLRGRRMLLLLDDVSAEQQVRPIAEALAGGLLLLTSRRTLVGLDGARHLVLDVLTVAESLRLLLAEGGTAAAADPEAAREIVRLSGRLPLALRVAGATLAARPHWTAADLARRLAGAATPLDLLSAGGLDVRTVLDVGYRELASAERRAFRLLSLTPDSGFSAWTAAVLLHTTPDRAERSLELLTEARMLEVATHETGHRYRYHRLLRALARERLLAEEPQEQRLAAARRLGGALLLLARRAGDRLQPGRASPWPPPPDTGVPALDAARIIGPTPARWFQEEADALLHGVQQAHRGEDWTLAWQLADAVTPYLEAAGRWQGWHEVLALGLDAAERDRSGAARARLLASRGELAWQRMRTAAAHGHFAEARALFEQDGDPSGVLRCLVGAGDAALSEGDAERAATSYGAALDRAARARDARAEADARRGLALAEVLAGRPEEALRTFQEFIGAAERLGDNRWVRLGQRNADRLLEHLMDWYTPSRGRTPPALEARPGVWLVPAAGAA
ncbi:BTAD domain-containing putative transcriptional regulator [Streptomyces sp. NPDC001380]|uniref:AfsR/SARP family transcriptional regulator n=1 Tax=Streptomyces sp. NPDC001380 TaxID=3364566 RepID=UPI0036BC590D